MKEKDDKGEHYVYLYRDEKSRPRYVGYGRTPARATSHLQRSHNPGLDAFLKENRYSLEIAGPFGSCETGLAVETAIMSLLQPDFNVAKGHTESRFRALGVPEKFSKHTVEAALTRADFLSSYDSILFVYINNRDFDDGRVGYDPALPPADSQILQRIDRWWQLGSYVKDWCSKPKSSPSILVGVHGRPGSQMIIGAVNVSQKGWASAEQDGPLFSVPTTGPADLDANGWRGRRIDKDAGIKFGSFRHQSYLILERNRVLGGHPSIQA